MPTNPRSFPTVYVVSLVSVSVRMRNPWIEYSWSVYLRGDNELVRRYTTRDGRVQDVVVIPNLTPSGWKAGDPLLGGAAEVSAERPPVAHQGDAYVVRS